jgi:hypothetical protein
MSSSDDPRSQTTQERWIVNPHNETELLCGAYDDGDGASVGADFYYSGNQDAAVAACLLAADAPRLRAENERLRALVTRLTDVSRCLAAELPDPGTEALAAIYCGERFIYG